VPLTLSAPLFKLADLQDEHLTLFNQWMTAIAQAINAQAGHGGPVKLASSLDLNGNSIINTGPPVKPSDVVTLDYAMKNFSPAAVRPQLESTSKTPLLSYRQLNNQVQRENYSSFLQGVLNTAPTANTSILTATPPAGGSIDVTVSAGFLQHVDGSQVPYASRTDTLPIATSYSITTLSRTAGVVTATLGSTYLGAINDQIGITGAIATQWQGVFVVANIAGNVVTYNQGGANDSESGGILTLVVTYYYTISRGQNHLGLSALGAGDTWSNRVGASLDGTTIVAVVVITVAGLDPLNSAAGATIPVSGSSLPVIRRL